MRSFTVFALALPAVAFAAAVPRGDGYGSTGGSESCNTGPVQCCNQVQSASNPSVGALAGLLGIALGSITGLVGLNCNPISAVVGIGGNSCSAQPVCCDNNNFGGLISLGCTPINVNL